MQDPKKINVTSGVVSNGKIYSLEFHEDNHDANMKVTDQGVSTYYPISGGGETNIIPYSGGSIDTDTTSLLALRDDALKLNLMRSSATDVHFVFEADSNFLTNAKFGIITLQVSINTTGGGGIKLMYKDMTGNVVNVAGGVHQTSGNHAITFAYFGSSSLQLIAFSEY